MKKKHYFSIAVFSYLFFLLVTIPISTIKNTINENTALTLRGTSGSIWNGHANYITVNKKITLTNTTWSFNAWKILIGKISFLINTNYNQQNITSEINTSFLQQYSVNNLSAKISAENLAELASIPLVQLSGMLSVDIDHAHWKADNLPSASGEIIWREAAITVAETASLGKITIRLNETDEHPIEALISNTSGDISIDGNAELIPDADYSVNIKLTPTAQANDNIKNSLILFSKRQRDGSFLVKKSGPINQFGF